MHPAISHVLKFFAYGHLPERLQEISRPFASLAKEVADRFPDNQETTGRALETVGSQGRRCESFSVTKE